MNLQALTNLRNLGYTILEEDRPIGFGSWKTCLLGQYVRAYHGRLGHPDEYQQAAAHFGISFDEAGKLFDPAGSKKQQLVCELIRLVHGAVPGELAKMTIPGNKCDEAAKRILRKRLKFLDKLIERALAQQDLNGVLKDIGQTSEKGSSLAGCA